MKRRTVVASIAGAIALTATVGLAAPAQAASPGGSCVQQGLGTLKDLGLLKAAAQKQIDYSTLADVQNGPIFADLPENSFLSLGQVVKLHAQNPSLFAWCR